MSIGKENEVKLVGGHNNQLKYSDCSKTDVLERIQKLLAALEIQHTPMNERTQRDTYFDTEDLQIFHNNGCARIRVLSENGRTDHKATLKTPSDSKIFALPNALSRHEEEGTYRSEDEFIRDVKSRFGIKHDKKILKQIIVNNSRNYCNITTETGNYELSYDKFYYINSQDDSTSETFYEIEIEMNTPDSTPQFQQEDKQIMTLAKILKNVMGFHLDMKTKYARGIGWMDKKNSFENKFFIVFDIVEYSKEYSIIQRKKIEKFTDIISKHLSSLDNAESIPIGDGMILITHTDKNIFVFLNEVFSHLKQSNKTRTRAQQIHLHTAVHMGNVMEYIDINGNRNYAGNGINIAYRINNAADSNQILLSDVFYHYMIEKGEIEEDNVKELPSIIAKHSIEIKVFNYYDNFTEIGKKV